MTIEDQIEMTLDKIRPFIQRDGGDIVFDSFIDGVVYVKMVGACDGCYLAAADISEGVAIILKEEVPGVLEVLPVDMKPQD